MSANNARSSWIFPIKRAEGARLDQVQRKRGMHETLLVFLSSFPRWSKSSNQKREVTKFSRNLLEHGRSSSVYARCFFLISFLSLASFFAFPLPISRYELATFVGSFPRRIIILQFRRHAAPNQQSSESMSFFPFATNSAGVHAPSISSYRRRRRFALGVSSLRGSRACLLLY